MELFPKMRVVATHMGGYSVWDEAEKLLKDTDCMLDVSSSLMFMDEATAQHYINTYGADRLLFGTDFPLWNPVTETERFMRIKMSDEAREKIAFKNAERILGL